MSLRTFWIWTAALSSVIALYVFCWYMDDGFLIIGIPFTILYPIVICSMLSVLYLLLSLTTWRREGTG